MNEQLERIKSKLEQLRRLDPAYQLFGAARHKYGLNPTIPEEEIRRFELAHDITLPGGYAAFLTKIGFRLQTAGKPLKPCKTIFTYSSLEPNF